ncbi:MAG: PqqD family protein [Gemmatimonadales bacterium]|nr:PqqD family protein [Gemmatimonadales bacterium]
MSATWRASADALVATLDGEAVLLHLGTKRYFRLNATGVAIWSAATEGHDRAGIMAALVAAFDVPADEAGREVDRLLGELVAAGLLEGDGR